jgi:hypothetical protein
MAKVPGAATVKSRLHAALGAERATALYRCFLQDTMEMVAAVPDVARVVAFTPSAARATMAALAPPGFALLAQREGDLGERLAGLFADLAAAGHPAAVVLGGDSPTLPAAYVRRAVHALEAGLADVVLGPTDDGGYYLIGLSAPEPALFAAIPWSTARVLDATLESARRLRLTVHLLPRWFDVDTPGDLARLRAELAATPEGAPLTRALVRTLAL